MLGQTLLVALSLAAPLPAEISNKPVIIPARKHPGGNAEAVALSADAKYIAAGFGGPSTGRFPLKPSGGGVFVWERATGKQVFSRGEFGDILMIGFSRDGRYLAYSRIYTPGDSVRADTTALIDLQSKEVVKKWREPAFAFSPTEDLLIVGGGRQTEVFDLKKLATARMVDVRNARRFAFTPDGKFAAALCYHFKGRTGRPTGLALFSPHKEKPLFRWRDETLRQAQALALTPDGPRVITGHVEGNARIWTADNNVKPHSIDIGSKLAVCPFLLDEGKTLALATQPANGVSWSYDRTQPSGFKFEKGKTPPSCEVRLLDLATLKPRRIWRFEDASFRTHYARFGSGRDRPEYNPARFAVSADGKFVATGCNGCCIVDAVTAKLIRTFERKSE